MAPNIEENDPDPCKLDYRNIINFLKNSNPTEKIILLEAIRWVN